MNYTLHQLQVFRKIAETRSVTRAAEELHLTQPAVSIQLRNFQAQFDISLTEVVGRKVYITDFGKEIALLAEGILDQAYAINRKTHEYRGQLSGRLKISVVSTGKYVMPYFLSDFMQLHAGVELFMDVTNKARVIESLENNEVDFSLVSILPAKLKVDRLDLLQNRLFLVGSSSQKVAGRVHTKDIFKTLPLIYRERGSGTRQAMERFIERNRIPVVKKMELTSNEAVKQAVMAGLGFSIMPLIGIRNEIQLKQLKIVPVQGLPITTTWSLISLKGKKPSPVAGAFQEFLKREKNRIVHDKFDWFEKS